MRKFQAIIFLFMLGVAGCGEQAQEPSVQVEAVPDPMALEQFVMRNGEILEAILARLEREGIEHWLNDDGSVGFYARDAKTVDAIAYAEIGNWVTLQ